MFNVDAARALLRRYAVEKDVPQLLAGIPRQVEVTCRSKGDTNFYFILNHQDHSVRVSPGPGYFDLLEKKDAPPAFALGAYQFTVLRKTKNAGENQPKPDLQRRAGRRP